MKPSQVNHVGLIVADLDAAERFLTEVFGLTPAGIDPNPGVAARFYDAGGITVQIVEDAKRLRGAPIARLDHIAFDVEDIDEVVSAAATHGAETVWDEPVVHRGNHRAQFITDRGGLGIVFQLDDERGSAAGRPFKPEDQETLSRAMQGD